MNPVKCELCGAECFDKFYFSRLKYGNAFAKLCPTCWRSEGEPIGADSATLYTLTKSGWRTVKHAGQGCCLCEAEFSQLDEKKAIFIGPMFHGLAHRSCK